MGNTTGVQSQNSKRIKRILALLETAGTIEDMDLPDLKLHELKGDRSGIWSVTVSGNYRIPNKLISYKKINGNLTFTEQIK